jgi:hypothetical protein
MSLLQDVIHVIYSAAPSTAVRESEIAFPVIQTFHILGIILMAGTIALVDLRLLGVIFRKVPAINIARPLLPVTWIGFAVMVVSGGLLFAAQSEKIYLNRFLQVKLILLVIAGLNVIAFHSTTYKSITEWGVTREPPGHAKIAAALSLALWAAVIVTGRFIAYF